jgi:DNA primase
MPNLRPGKQLRIALLPEGEDPDDFIRSRGKAKFQERIENAAPLSAFLYRAELDRIDESRPEQRAHLRKTLEDLARSCADSFVADEFSRSFKELFYEDFGWKHKQSQVVFKSAVRTSPRVAPDLARLYVRSALFGLTRYPSVAATHLEEVAAIPITHPDLQRWRDAIGEAVVINPNLAEDGIRQILDAKLLPQTIRMNVRSDLRFAFTRQKTPQEQAVKQLQTLVSFLASETALRDQMQEYDKLAESTADDDKYSVIETARQQMREARAALFNDSANWDEEL